MDCNGCAKQDHCAWCASENVCTTISEAFSKDCRGLVFEPPCPENYVAGKVILFRHFSSRFLFTSYVIIILMNSPHIPILDNVIVGNLIVRADPTFGGGELNLTGMVLLSF